jgi:phage-related protein
VLWTIGYYSEEVRLAIEALPVGIRASYARLADLLEEFGVDLRMPHSRAMGGGLFELRLRGSEGIARVFYCTKVGKRIVILHSFVKKTQETPKRELEIARKRQREVGKS